MLPLLWTLASVILGLAVHALGHAVAGRLLGARYRPLLRIGGRRGLRPLLVGLLALPLRAVTDHIHAIPLGRERLKRNVTVAVLAGPVATLALALACGALLMAGGSLGRIATAPAVASLVLTVAVLAPVEWRSLSSDGHILFTVLRGGPRADRLCALAALGWAGLADVRPRDWDAELVGFATAVPDSSPDDLFGWFYAYLHIQDLSAGDAIGSFYARGVGGLEGLRAVHRGRIACELAFIAAYYYRDAGAARAILFAAWPEARLRDFHHSRFARYEVFPSARLAAALLMADGRSDRAAVLLRNVLAEPSWLQFQFGPTQAQGSACEREWLAELLQEAEQLAESARLTEAERPHVGEASGPEADQPDSPLLPGSAEQAARPAEVALGTVARPPAAQQRPVRAGAGPAVRSRVAGGAGPLLPPLVLALAGLAICLRSDPSSAARAGGSAAAVQIDLLLGGLLALCGLAVVFAVLQARRGHDPSGMRLYAVAGSVGLCIVPALLWRFGIHKDDAFSVALIGVWSLVAAWRMPDGSPSDDAGAVDDRPVRLPGLTWKGNLRVALLGVVLFPSALTMVTGQDWLLRILLDSGSAPSALSGNVTEVKRTLSGAPITFRFEQDVSSDTVQAVEDGAAMAEAYYLRSFGAATQRPVVLEVRGSSSEGMNVGGFTAGHRIVLATMSPLGGQFSSFFLRQAAAHELFHVLQYELSDGRMLRNGPDWLVEGSAELASLAVLMDDQELSYGDMVSCEVAVLGPRLENGPALQDLSGQSGMLHHMQQRYALATLGVDNATETRGVPALAIYFRELASSDWQSAFRTAFGRSPETFYQQFADGRGDYPAPHRSACDFYADD